MNLHHHPFFTPWTDPRSGVTSYVLSERVAPLQQSFYFTNASVSADERWLWFYTAFPPSPHKMLGVVSLDPAQPFIRHFPAAAFTSASPLVAPEGDAVYFCQGASVWRQGLEGEPQVVCTLGDDYIRRRRVERLATHLTLTPDGRHLLLDGQVGNEWFVGLGDIRSGEVQVIREFTSHHNHAQFSPVHPDLFLIPADQQTDPNTGKFIHHDFRIYLMDVPGSRYECLTPHIHCSPYHGACHEWWSADGKVCYIDYDHGAYEYDLETREHTHVWREPLCHAHCDGTRRYWCADQSPYYWEQTPCQVLFYDRVRDTRTAIASALPLPPYPRGKYHLDPHPQFSPRGTHVVYTTTVLGQVDVALAPVADILAQHAG